MIIDTHQHFGRKLNFDLLEEDILFSIEKYRLDFVLISSIEASEVDHQQNLIPMEYQTSQIDANKKILEFAKKHSDKIGVAVWVKPLLEEPDDELDKLIEENRKYIYAIKFHPYHSKISFSSDKVKAYMYLARKYDLPVIVHTANDELSSPWRVYEMALEYKDINFVMVHLGLGTDNEDAIEILKRRLPNIYGDTTWVNYNIIKRIIKEIDSLHIMFGTDSPIDGKDTLGKDIYQDYLVKLKNEISKDDYDRLMYKNALKLFKINKE